MRNRIELDMKKITTLVVLGLWLLSATATRAQTNRLIMARPVGLPTFVGGEYKNVVEPVEGDLIGGGRRINIESDILGDAYIGGGDVNFAGSVDQDLIVAGGKVYVSGRVGKNLIVGGGKVVIEEGAMVGGYVLAGGGEVEINGQVEGSVRVGAGKLTIGEMASIGGNLEADVEEVNVSSESRIMGETNVRKHEKTTPTQQDNTKRMMRGIRMTGEIISLLSKTVTLLILVWLGGGLMGVAGLQLMKFGITLWRGLVAIVVVPVASILIMTTVLGIPVGFILLMVYGVAIYLSSLVTAMAIGSLASKKGWLKTKNNYLLALAGLVALEAMGWLPIVGWIVKMIAVIVGMGIVYKVVVVRKQTLKKDN
jgi:hypothetical protein